MFWDNDKGNFWQFSGEGWEGLICSLMGPSSAQQPNDREVNAAWRTRSKKPCILGFERWTTALAEYSLRKEIVRSPTARPCLIKSATLVSKNIVHLEFSAVAHSGLFWDFCRYPEKLEGITIFVVAPFVHRWHPVRTHPSENKKKKCLLCFSLKWKVRYPYHAHKKWLQWCLSRLMAIPVTWKAPRTAQSCIAVAIYCTIIA